MILVINQRLEGFSFLSPISSSRPIGTGSPSYTHHGNDALAEGNVDADGDNDGFPPPTFDMSIFRHVILTKVKLRNQHHWAYDMIGAQFAYKQGELEDEIGDRN